MSLQKPGADVVARAAAVARIAVNLEMAYDVIDELARVPGKYPELLAQLSRLIAKVIRDVERKLQEAGGAQLDWSEGCAGGSRGKKVRSEVEVLRAAYCKLSRWPALLERLFAELEARGEQERPAVLRKFAALAVAPDGLTNRLNEILNK